MGQASVSRIETGRGTPSVVTLERILDALEAPKRLRARTLDHLRALLTEMSSWEAVVQAGIRREQDRVRRIEAASSTIRIFSPALVPGLLQTVPYAERVLTLAGQRWGGAADVPEAVAARMERQGILMDTSKTFGFVVTEAALRWRIVSPQLMADQLERLDAVGRLPNVDLAVLPLAAEIPAVPLNTFVLLDERLCIVENMHGGTELRDPRDLAMYGRIYEAFREVSLDGSKARALIAKLAADHRRRSAAQPLDH